MLTIERLDVQGFRGIRRRASLLFDQKSVLLFGENGSGKSSFVDALERLLAGRVSTLDGRGGLSSSRHGPHIRGDDHPQQISMVLANASRSVIDLGTDPGTISSDAQAYLGIARENLFILRRKQLLDFVDSQPRDRYTLLRPFLRLDTVEGWEASLRETHHSLESSAQAMVLVESRARNDVARLIGTSDNAPLTPEQVLAAASRILASVQRAPVTSLDDARTSVADLADTIASFGDMELQARLATASIATTQLQETVASLDVTGCITALRDLREREAHEAHSLYEAVLAEGALWITQESRDTCPLCEQPIVRGELIDRISERLGAAKDLLRERTAVKSTAEGVRQRAAVAIDAVRTTQRAIQALAPKLDIPATEAFNVLALYLASLQQACSGALHELDLRLVDSLADRQGEVDQAMIKLRELHDTLQLRRLETSSQSMIQGLLTAQQSLRELLERWDRLLESRVAAVTGNVKARIARQLYDAAESARKEEVQRLFDELSEQIDSIYRELHPDEQHGNVRLELRDAVQRSVNLRADFYEKSTEDPRAYYSEAHLDTLGVSVFLALRRWYFREYPEFNLLVLDDVLTSVDAQHATRLAELLLREFKSFQMLVTTHDRIWFEHLRDIQARCGVAPNFVNKIIHKWTIDDGPDLREPEDERQELERLLSEGSAEQIAVMAGRLLEHTLQEMRYSLGLRVQAKRGEQYAIGDLWPAFYAEVKRTYPSLYSAARQALDALDVRWPIRNWLGAHWNTWARNIARSAAVEFGRAVRDLFDAVFCPTCHRFVSPSPAPLGQLACRCGTRLYPASGKAAVPPKTRDQLVQETRGALRDASLNTETYFRWKEAERRRED